MRRREFLGYLSSAAAWPLAARAQQGDRVRRLATLIAISESDPQAPLRIAAIRNGLKELGWIEGRNIAFDFRYSGGNAESLQASAAELVRLRPDAIIAGNTTALSAMKQETMTIPIVFAQVEEPVANGFVASLARPGGNITGFMNFEEAMSLKWLDVLKQLAPSVARVAFIYDPANPTGMRSLQTITTGAPSFGVEVSGISVQDGAAIQSAIELFAAGPNGGVIVQGGPTTATHRDLIVTLAARLHLPAIYPYRYFATSGGLASYGSDPVDLYRRAASYIDRILKGETPAELPVQQPIKYELVINLRTAKALGLNIPDKLLFTADEIIE